MDSGCLSDNFLTAYTLAISGYLCVDRPGHWASDNWRRRKELGRTGCLVHC